MKNALIHIDGKPVTVDAATFLRIEDAQPSIEHSPTCLECRQPVFVNDEIGARTGFRITAEETTGRQQKLPGFSHYKGNGNHGCSLYFANDPRFKAMQRQNSHSSLEKDRNLAALDKPFMRTAIADVQRYLMEALTGSPHLSAADTAFFAQVEKRCITWTGLAEHPWILGYLAPVLIGVKKRQFADGQKEIFYRPVGEQRFPVEAADGLNRHLYIPLEIKMFSSINGGRQAVLLPPQAGVIREFSVSHGEARMIAREAVAQRRGIARKPVQLALF